jgi:predicted metal-dependent enzyme (double-stranded beta helix superfamily)
MTESKTERTKKASAGWTEAWPWPDSLDALIAAPDHHSLLLEDARVRVLHTNIPPGAVVPLHTHRWGGVVYVLSSSHFIRRDQNGKVLLDTRQESRPGQTHVAHWASPLPPHTVENVGQSDISLLLFEIKDSGANL